jgi:FKBP-type peptidyl-prolyl cis-trans isomerase FkpA
MFRPLLFCSLLALLVAGCDSGSGDPAKVTYASALGVDLSSMTKSADGLYTKDVVSGTGAEAQAGKTVTVHYTGWLPDGTQFDSSRPSGHPFQFSLGTGSVIQGWDEGVPGMKVGGQRRLVIPSALGYGENGYPGVIPPNSVLVFDVELISVP